MGQGSIGLSFVAIKLYLCDFCDLKSSLKLILLDPSLMDQCYGHISGGYTKIRVPGWTVSMASHWRNLCGWLRSTCQAGISVSKLDKWECRAADSSCNSTVMDPGLGHQIHRSNLSLTERNSLDYEQFQTGLRDGNLRPTVLKCQVIAFTSLTCSTTSTNILQRGASSIGSLMWPFLLPDDWCFQLRA